MSKTLRPPSKKALDAMGIRFVPSNCYAPNHWSVKHIMYPFDGFDTREEYDAMEKARITNVIAYSLYRNGFSDQKEVLIKAILRIVGY